MERWESVVEGAVEKNLDFRSFENFGSLGCLFLLPGRSPNGLLEQAGVFYFWLVLHPTLSQQEG